MHTSDGRKVGGVDLLNAKRTQKGKTALVFLFGTIGGSEQREA
jgi:hypothetical protein